MKQIIYNCVQSEGISNDEENKNIEVSYKKAELYVIKDPEVDDADTGWGFHLANQISFMGGDEDEVKTVGHIVHWVEKSGPADYAGLRDGDKIMEINDTNVAEMDYEDVMKIINEIEGNEIKSGFQIPSRSLKFCYLFNLNLG